jgi:hypothetical protein
MEALATKIRTADAPGGDRQLFGRQVCRGKGEHRVHGTLSEMGMVVVSSTLAVGPIANTLDANSEPIGPPGEALQQAFPRFADDLAWWTQAAKAQRARKPSPY